ncbi:MAG: helix-turn-helix domain-containing protein [Chitinophagaceae bacterium]|nr:MAG: helix-turn-helix domain-containing protein [Chitinophagaceae bacterium]
MQLQTIPIKGMVCKRCLLTVENELLALGHTSVKATLGEVSYMAGENNDLAVIEERLSRLGFSLLEDKKAKMTNEVIRLIEEVYSGDYDFPHRFRFSELVKQRLQKDYDAISDAFIATEKKTIEQYIINYRITKVKELLVYSNLTLADIAFKLNFHSVAHLSTQFKQQTGLTASFFKEIKRQKEETAAASNPSYPSVS